MFISMYRYHVKPGCVDQVLELAAKLREYAITCEGNLGYITVAYPYEENTILGIEKWVSTDYQDKYKKCEALAEFQKNRKPYLVEGSLTREMYNAEERK